MQNNFFFAIIVVGVGRSGIPYQQIVTDYKSTINRTVDILSIGNLSVGLSQLPIRHLCRVADGNLPRKKFYQK